MANSPAIRYGNRRLRTVLSNSDTYFTFNGNTQFATLPPWDTLGDYDAYGSITWESDDPQDDVIEAIPPPVIRIGRVGPDYHYGYIRNTYLGDTSPIQNTTAPVSDGSLSLDFPPVGLYDTSFIKARFIMHGQGTLRTFLTGTRPDTGEFSSVVFQANGDITVTDLQGTIFTLTGALSGIDDGKHVALVINLVYAEDEVDIPYVEAVVDGTVTATANGAFLGMFLDKVEAMPLGQAIQNLEFDQGAASLRWAYSLNEATGVTASNSNEGTKNSTYFTNIQPYSWDLSGTEPDFGPPPNVQFYSGWETGVNQPSSANPDGWVIQPGWPDDVCVPVADRTRHPNSAYSAKINLKRSSFQTIPPDENQNQNARAHIVNYDHAKMLQDQDYWMGFSVFMEPGTFPNDSKDNDIQLWQVHGTGKIANVALLDPYLNEGYWDIVNRYGVHLGPLDKRFLSDTAGQIPYEDWVNGQWLDVVCHLRMSYNSSGHIEIWHNGQQIVDWQGVNMYSGVNGEPADPNSTMIFTLGMYKPLFAKQPSDVTEYTCWYDSFTMTTAEQGQNGYSSVDPSIDRGY